MVKVSQHDEKPEVIKVDLSSPEGLNQIALLVQNQASKPILAINAPDKACMLKALAIGASGSTSKLITDAEMQLVLQSLLQEAVLIDSLRGETPDFLVLPQRRLKEKLERWQYSVAVEIVNYWRAECFPFKVTVAGLLQQLKVANWIIYLEKGKEKLSLTQKIDRLIESLCQNKNFVDYSEKLEYIASYLDKWYFSKNLSNSCCVAIIKANGLYVRKASLFRLRKLMKLWSKAGSYTVSQWLEKLISSLRKIEAEFEYSRQESLKRANFALVAYENLSNKLERDSLVKDFESANRALKFQYSEKINAEINGAASQIMAEIIGELEIKSSHVAGTDTILYNLIQSLQASIGDNSPLPDLSWSEEDIAKLGIKSIRDSLEKEIGKPLVSWCKLSPTEHEIIYGKLLEYARNLALKLILERY